VGICADIDRLPRPPRRRPSPATLAADTPLAGSDPPARRRCATNPLEVESGLTAPLSDLVQYGGNPSPSQIPPDLVAGFGACSLTIDRAWRVTSISPQAAAWFGVTPSEILGADGRLHLPLNPPVFEALKSSMALRETWHAKAPSVLRPGLWLEIQVLPLETGAAVYFQPVTGERLNQLIDGSAGEPQLLGAGAAEVALLDERGLIVSANATWRSAMAARTPNRRSPGVGASYVEACRQLIPDLDALALRLALNQLAQRKLQTFTHPYTVLTPQGPRLRQMCIYALRIRGAARLIAIHEDLGDVARANAALLKATEQLLSAQQDERERIAIELHDSTGQHLVAVGLGIGKLQRIFGAGHEIRGDLDTMAASLQEAHREIRILSYLLKPPSLARSGLEETLRRFVRGFGVRTGLSSHFTVEGHIDSAIADVQHAALRVVQEALANVHRHAEATVVHVALTHRDGRLSIRIADDGKGIEALQNGDLEEIAVGVGIAGMRGRVEQLGGVLDIRCNGAGTTVTATIPSPATRRASLDKVVDAA
jgi:two-component system, NarL family, sensor kinase